MKRLLALALLGLILVGCNGDRIDAYKRACADAGGHIYQPDQILWCLSDDGRFVEVYP